MPRFIIPSSSQKRTLLISMMLIFASLNSTAQGIRTNLIGRVFKNLNEIKEIKNYSGLHAKMIPTENFGSQDKFAVIQITDTVEKKYIIIFEEILDEAGTTVPRKKILDVLVVNYKALENWISLCGECYQDSIYKPKLIALVNTQPDTDYTTRIRKAWRLDFEAKQIVSVKDLSTIKCSNPDEGCVGE